MSRFTSKKESNLTCAQCGCVGAYYCTGKRDQDVFSEIMKDVKSTSADDIKEALLDNANGPIYQAINGKGT